MQITLSDTLTRLPPPHVMCFALDKDVLEALYHAVNELRLLKFESKEKQDEMRSRMTKFDAAESIRVVPFKYHGRFVYRIVMTFPSWIWYCSVFAESWTLFAGIGGIPFDDYDGRPLMPSPSRIKWNAVRRRMRGLARALVVFGTLLEEMQLRPDGSKYRHVKARFETMAAAPLV